MLSGCTDEGKKGLPELKKNAFAGHKGWKKMDCTQYLSGTCSKYARFDRLWPFIV